MNQLKGAAGEYWQYICYTGKRILTCFTVICLYLVFALPCILLYRCAFGPK